jgi:S-layer homology domain
MTRWRSWLAILPTILYMVSPAFGQTGSPVGNPEMNPNSPLAAPQPREFGVEDVAILNIGPCGLQPRGSAAYTNVENSNCQRVAPLSGFLSLGADVQLPAGAVITEVTIDYFDSHTTSNPAFGLFRVSHTGQLTNLFNVTVPGTFSGGNNTTTIPLSTPETVDNETNNYIFLTILDRTGAEVEGFFRAAIKYRRQVSPAPAVATFNDVPTSHPFFQFIEALFASGITAGCSMTPPLYCPEAPLTRGQMAVFLGKALGLHFAP